MSVKKKTGSQLNVDSHDIVANYATYQKHYDSLGRNILSALEEFLDENNISYLSITHRIKAEQSIREKIERKHYNDPSNQIEDICGVRIICYYQTDVDKILEIINKEFEVTADENKEDTLAEDQFGYRSHHAIVKMNKEWLKAPGYRNLKNLKAEIQVRTVLMHAWAEIQHKLVYKKEDDVPKHLKRKLSRISAKLEESDEQFEEVRKARLEYQQKVVLPALENDKNIELNLDSLQALIDYRFPYRTKLIQSTNDLLSELLKCNITIEELNKVFDLSQLRSEEVFAEVAKAENYDSSRFAQVGAARILLDIRSTKYRNFRREQGLPWNPKMKELQQKFDKGEL